MTKQYELLLIVLLLGVVLPSFCLAFSMFFDMTIKPKLEKIPFFKKREKIKELKELLNNSIKDYDNLMYKYYIAYGSAPDYVLDGYDERLTNIEKRINYYENQIKDLTNKK